jgi:hypothetical protein
MATSPGNRIQFLLQSTSLNGVDFVEVPNPGQPILRVHFLTTLALAGSIANPLITGGETIPNIAVNPIDDTTDWSVDPEGRPILRLITQAIGDFSYYTLTLTSAKLDLYYSTTTFSFHPNCNTNLDCDAPAPPCPPLAGNPPPIEYLAKDFLSFRQALLDFSALRYPEWQERAEADFGMMFLEALASMADDLSYTQDRIAAEATLQTATQRRSLVSLARLVDYEPRPATSATVQLQLNVTHGTVAIPAGTQVTGVTPDGQTVVFEIGTGLLDSSTYPVSALWNKSTASPESIAPFLWDASQVCLAAGATAMWVAGHGFGFPVGMALLIDTTAQPPSDPPIREIIHILTVAEQTDELFSKPVTCITWDASEALQSDHDLTQTLLAGNLVPATQGARSSESFAILAPPPGKPSMPLAVVRTGPNSTPASFAPMYLHTLAQTPLAWLAPDSTSAPAPEILLTAQPVTGPPVPWTWYSSLLQTELYAAGFTLDRASYIPIATNSDGTTAWEYDGDSGDTLRFGDQNFGTIPDPGTVFQATYRVTSGAAGNLAADTITGISPTAASYLISVTNPFAATGGADEESALSIRRLAPQAFRANRYNAVLASDYAAAAQTLPWVERAGTVFRWTGSWLTVFTTADPEGSEQISSAEQLQLIQLLNRRRLAGYESYCPPPLYISVDLEVYVCAKPTVFNADVQTAVQTALSAARNADGTTGFFYVDNFTFGQPLESSALQAAIQNAYGVAGVHQILYRQRGIIVDYIPLPDEVLIQPNQILRLDNDPSRPERGSLLVYVDGGK